MRKVTEKLGLSIPPFGLRRCLVIDAETQEQNRCRLTVTVVSSDGTPMTFLQSVRVDGTRQVARAEPFPIHVYEDLELGVELKLGLEFIGHCN